jgi:capsular exopolysaccharide synthesis family protein
MDQQNQNSSASNRGAITVRRPAGLTERRGYYLAEMPYAMEAAETADKGEGLFEYWRTLVRHRKTIFLSSLAGLILGLAVCVPMTPVYRAETSVEVLSMNQDFLNMKQASPTTVNDGSTDTSEETTQAKLLQSAKLRKRVFAKLSPGSVAKLKAKPKLATTGWRSWLRRSEPVQLTRRESTLLKTAESVKVREAPHTRLLEISVDSPDPQLAADYANTLTQEFIAENAEERWASTQVTGDWLQRELQDTRDKLRRSETALQDYARSSGIIFTDDNSNVVTEKLQQMQQALSAATTDRISKQSRFELAQNSPPESLADVLNDAALRETQGKINDLNRQIADLSAVYNPGYSKVKRLQAELASLQVAFNSQRADILSRIKTDYQESSRKERLLANAYEMQTREVTGQGEKSIQYNILKRDVDSNRLLYDTMLQQMKQSTVAAALRASNVRVVDAADVPDIPIFPNFKLNAVAGMFAGAFLSAIVVIVREQMDQTLQKPGDIKQWVNLPELGTIPDASFSGKRALSGKKGKDPAVEPPKRPLLSASAPNLAELIAWQNHPSLIAEAFRSALASILFAGDRSIHPRILMFTSANPAEGKTTVVSNLALAAAEVRLNVLIIDADLRRPRLHEVFGLGNSFGLGDLLAQGLDEANLFEAVQSTRIPNVRLLTAGAPNHSSAHLLYSPNLAVMLKRFKAEYDLILIDTPPMMQMTDARVIARHAEAVVLVAHSGQTSRASLVAAKNRFEEDGIPVLGSVLNQWDLKRTGLPEYEHYREYA